MDGGKENDYLFGGIGFDSIYGGEGDDKLFRQGDNDILSGWYGYDTLTGGAGADQFVFFEYQEQPDHITDFEQGIDKIVIHSHGFKDTFSSNRFTYSPGTGEVSFIKTIPVTGIDDFQTIAVIDNHAQFSTLAFIDLIITD